MMQLVEPSPRLSLVAATVGRSDELVRLLDSIDKQLTADVEVIIVDQNDDERVKSCLERVALRTRCIHIHSRRGLSLARNAGLEVASGAIVGFPDDDCWYPEGFLHRVGTWFARNGKHDLLCTVLRDEEGR